MVTKFKLKQSENLILNQEQTLAAQKNENLNTQLLLNQKESKLALAQKELAILTKSKNLKTTILIGIALLMVLIGIFIVILWEKIKIQRNSGKILSNAASKMTEAKIELDNFTSIVQDEKQKSPTDLASIQNKFENFEQTITNVISETQNFGFRISHEIKGPLKIIQARLEKISSNLNPDQVQNLNEINHQVFKMQEMGDKLLNASKNPKNLNLS
ncbi:MAG: HAMP domain-containing histidine kinase [Saprospiraceae bacterium]|nr:HAMP domain-containing histidine kinase [Saprospiraceae bacterium]